MWGIESFVIYADREKVVVVSSGIVDEIARLQRTHNTVFLLDSYFYPSYDELWRVYLEPIVFVNSSSITIYSWKRHWIDLFRYHFREFLSNTTVLNKLRYFYMLNNVSFIFTNITVEKDIGVEITVPYTLFGSNVKVRRLIVRSHMGFWSIFGIGYGFS